MWDIYRVIADVPNWKGLADLLNVKSSDIEANCALDDDRAACHRRSIILRYCNSKSSWNPCEFAEDTARALEEMKHNFQAEELRQLLCGTSWANHAVEHITSFIHR